MNKEELQQRIAAREKQVSEIVAQILDSTKKGEYSIAKSSAHWLASVFDDLTWLSNRLADID